jgi:hypothetical protein
MFVCCECCVLSGRGLCDGPITRPEKSYRLWCVIACGQMNNNPLHLTWLGSQKLDLERKKERKKERKQRDALGYRCGCWRM